MVSVYLLLVLIVLHIIYGNVIKAILGKLHIQVLKRDAGVLVVPLLKQKNYVERFLKIF
jgi:small neutral amino acid transporter SnatA (MarC family)